MTRTTNNTEGRSETVAWRVTTQDQDGTTRTAEWRCTSAAEAERAAARPGRRVTCCEPVRN